MRHAVTLRLPVDNQRRGSDLPGIAYFMGEGQSAEEHQPNGADDPFVADLLTAVDHPELQRREDIIGQQFALVWLSEAELEAGPIQPPPDTRRPGEHEADDDGANAWDAPNGDFPWDPRATRWVYLAKRSGDPNAGLAQASHRARTTASPGRTRVCSHP